MRSRPPIRADAIGFVFHQPSPVPFHSKLRGYFQNLATAFVKVGVFVNVPETKWFELSRVQSQPVAVPWDENPEYCLQFGVMSMKAFRIHNSASLRNWRIRLMPGCSTRMCPTSTGHRAKPLIGRSHEKRPPLATIFSPEA
jgi:phosphoribosylanthranilate isomerase